MLRFRREFSSVTVLGAAGRLKFQSITLFRHGEQSARSGETGWGAPKLR